MNKTYDIDLLRTLVSIADLGSFARAADALHRTQAAVSQQMQRLEAISRLPLFETRGRRRVLTARGEQLLAHARRILAIHDEAVAAMDLGATEGTLRLGASQGIADRALPVLLKEFRGIYPRVRLEVSVEPSTQLLSRFAGGELDLALTVATGEPSTGAEVISEDEMVWLIPAQEIRPLDIPLALAVFPGECGYRKLALGALDDVGLPWRIAFESESLNAILSAVNAGLGITARTRSAMTPGLREARTDDRLPPLPSVRLCLHANPQSPTAGVMAAWIRETGLLPR